MRIELQKSLKRKHARWKRRLRPLNEQFFSCRNSFAKFRNANAVSAFWYPELNFGDKLTPDLLRFFGAKPLFSPVFHDCDVVGVGSILELVPDSYNGAILGAGFISSDTVKEFGSADILLVRGKLTRSKLHLSKSISVGDPGIIANTVFKNLIRKERPRYQIGIVPHYTHQKSKAISEMKRRHGNNATIVNVRQSPAKVVRAIAECECVISSSLHGLIVAHSLGIPTLVAEIEEKPLRGGRFKFFDYYSVYDMEPTFYQLRGDESLWKLRSNCEAIDPAKVSSVQASVIEVYESQFFGSA